MSDAGQFEGIYTEIDVAQLIPLSSGTLAKIMDLGSQKS